jgi:Rrf2 family transcriptional regulator, nitric oxide-sensitive transcriptional repressor
MRLSKYSDYALRVVMYAALREPELATIDEVADGFDISRHHLVKIVHALGRAGFLATRRGIGGGFTLAQPAAKISLGDVVRLTEIDESVIDCKDRRNQPCRIFPVCRLKGVLAEAGTAFFAVLDRYSLEDLVKQKADMRQLLKM